MIRSVPFAAQRRGALFPSCLAACVALAASGCGRDLSPGEPFVIAIPGKQTALGLIALPDGRLLAAGKSSPGPADRVLLARFLPAGQLDPSFGDGASGTPGIIVTEVFAFGATSSSLGAALALQPDGKVVVAGRAWGVGHASQIAVLRYLADGTPDLSFGRAGTVVFDPNPNFVIPSSESSAEANAVAIGADGAIYVGGSAAVHHAPTAAYWSDFALVRLRPDGSVDHTFGKGGVVIEDFGSSAFIRSLVVHGDGRVVVAGHADRGATGYDLTMVRYRADGSIDAGFGAQGRVTQDLGGDDRIWSLLLLEDGRYLAGGQTTSDPEGKRPSFVIARFDGSGAFDSTFGAMGRTVSSFPAGIAVGRSLGVAGTGYWLAGFATGDRGDRDFALARYDSAGRHDPCVSDSGLLTIPIREGIDDEAMAMAVQPDKTPVLAGHSGDHMVLDRLSSLGCGVTIRVH